MNIDDINNEIIGTLKISFLVIIAIMLFTKLGLDISWYSAFGIGTSIGLIVAIIIFFVKVANPSRD